MQSCNRKDIQFKIGVGCRVLLLSSVWPLQASQQQSYTERWEQGSSSNQPGWQQKPELASLFLVPPHPGCPGKRTIKQLLLLYSHKGWRQQMKSPLHSVCCWIVQIKFVLRPDIRSDLGLKFSPNSGLTFACHHLKGLRPEFGLRTKSDLFYQVTQCDLKLDSWITTAAAATTVTCVEHHTWSCRVTLYVNNIQNWGRDGRVVSVTELGSRGRGFESRCR